MAISRYPALVFGLLGICACGRDLGSESSDSNASRNEGSDAATDAPAIGSADPNDQISELADVSLEQHEPVTDQYGDWVLNACNFISQAEPGVPGLFWKSELVAGDDVAMYTIRTSPHEVIRLEASPGEVALTNLDAYWIPRLRLFEELGRELERGAPGELSALDVSTGDGDTFSVGVSTQENTTYDPLTGDGDTIGARWGQFTLSGRYLYQPPSAAYREPITIDGTTHTVSIDTPFDSDVYEIVIDTDGQALKVDSTGVFELRFTIYSVVGNEVTSSNKYLETRITKPGTYLLAVTASRSALRSFTSLPDDPAPTGVGAFTVQFIK